MITFVTPFILLLLLLLPALWALALLPHGASARPKTWRVWASVCARTLAFGALTGALAGAQLAWPARDLTVIFLLDRSDSVTPDQRGHAEAFVRQALAVLPPGDRAGLVVFGQQALVERLPSGDRALGAIAALPGGARSNLADAIRLALGLLPPSGQRRLVLLSDGGAGGDSAEQAARMAAARGVPLEVVPLAGGLAGLDAQISSVSLPTAARAGQKLRMVVNTVSTTPTPARLIISDNGTPVLSRQLQLAAGPGRLELELPEPTPAFNRYQVELTVEGDVRPQNNSAETYSIVSGRPNVLLVEGSAGAARALHDALTAARFNAEIVAPAAMPDTLAALGAYDAVLLIDVTLSALPITAVELFPAYVHDLGRGLAMIGGEHSFGAGGYRGSPIEAALPVDMDPRPTMQQPAVGVVVVIDISGSMAAEENGVSKVHLAALGAGQVAAQLRDDDEITVIPFDHEPQGIIGPLPGSRRSDMIARLDGVGTMGGGIMMDEALAVAARYLRDSAKPVRHLITITDGDDSTHRQAGKDLVRELHREDVTVTSLAVGSGADVPYLKELADLGGGRFFLTENASSIPSILVDETRQLLRPYLVEGVFAPTQDIASAQGGAGIFRGIPPLPQLRGYVASTPKDRAQVLLGTPAGDPLLAVWQHGLGRSMAWTSDLDGHWSGQLVRSGDFPRFAAQLIGWLLPPPGSPRLALETQISGDRLVLATRAQEDTGLAAGGLRVAGHVLAGDGSSRSVALREVMPGSYAVVVDTMPPGTYQIQLVATRADGEPFATASGGAVVDQTGEYRGQAGDRALLDSLAQISGGRTNIASADVYDPTEAALGASRDISLPLLWLALALLPADVAFRRLWLGRDTTQQK